jgi:hypothetical protein
MSSEPINSSSSDHISSTHHTSASSEPSALPTLLADAVEKYKNQVGMSLIQNQLATQLETCDSVESVAAVLEERVQAFREFLGRDRHPKIMKSIKRVVHILHTISTGLGGAVQIGHGIASIVRLNALMASVFFISGAYFIVLPTCETNICCHWHPPRRMCRLHPYARVLVTSSASDCEGRQCEL